MEAAHRRGHPGGREGHCLGQGLITPCGRGLKRLGQKGSASASASGHAVRTSLPPSVVGSNLEGQLAGQLVTPSLPPRRLYGRPRPF